VWCVELKRPALPDDGILVAPVTKHYVHETPTIPHGRIAIARHNFFPLSVIENFFKELPSKLSISQKL
jgi:hypothetical protein